MRCQKFLSCLAGEGLPACLKPGRGFWAAICALEETIDILAMDSDVLVVIKRKHGFGVRILGQISSSRFVRSPACVKNLRDHGGATVRGCGSEGVGLGPYGLTELAVPYPQCNI